MKKLKAKEVRVFTHGLKPTRWKRRLGPRFLRSEVRAPGCLFLPLIPRPLWSWGAEGQVHKALLVCLQMPPSNGAAYRVVILIRQETQNNCFYSSQWMLMHMTF